MQLMFDSGSFADTCDDFDHLLRDDCLSLGPADIGSSMLPPVATDTFAPDRLPQTVAGIPKGKGGSERRAAPSVVVRPAVYPASCGLRELSIRDGPCAAPPGPGSARSFTADAQPSCESTATLWAAPKPGFSRGCGVAPRKSEERQRTRTAKSRGTPRARRLNSPRGALTPTHLGTSYPVSPLIRPRPADLPATPARFTFARHSRERWLRSSAQRFTKL